jgi:hypothetical protein
VVTDWVGIIEELGAERSIDEDDLLWPWPLSQKKRQASGGMQSVKCPGMKRPRFMFRRCAG